MSATGCPRIDSHLLIFESEFKGHQPLFVSLLYCYALEHAEVGRVTFLIPAALSERIRDEEGLILVDSNDGRVAVCHLDHAELQACSHPVLWRRSLLLWRCAVRYLKRIDADRVSFLFLDHLQIPLALRFPWPNRVRVTGILFRPSLHSAYAERESNVSGRVKHLLKLISYRMFSGNRRLQSVMTLDPLFADSEIGHALFGERLYHLPDPCVYDLYSAEVPADKALIADAAKGRTTFLLFGALAQRKGVLAVLDALKQLPPETGERICLLLAGKVAGDIRGQVSEIFQGENLQTINGAKVVLLDRFLTNGELKGLVEQSDILLAPYLDFVGSSGVLLWAAGAGKPIIAPHNGLLAELVKKYGLGLTVDTRDVVAVAEALSSAAYAPGVLGADQDGMRRLAEESSPENFCRVFFSCS